MNTTQEQSSRPPGGNAGSSAQGSGSSAQGSPGAGGQGTRQDADDHAAGLVEQATEQGKARVEEYRGVAADKVEQLAESVKAAAGGLEGSDIGHLSQHINEFAGSMTRFSQGLREKSADELVRDVNRLARENPALFLAGGAALGFVLARLLRASTAGSGHDASAARSGMSYANGIDSLSQGAMRQSAEGAEGAGAASDAGIERHRSSPGPGAGGSGMAGIGTSGTSREGAAGSGVSLASGGFGGGTGASGSSGLGGLETPTGGFGTVRTSGTPDAGSGFGEGGFGSPAVPGVAVTDDIPRSSGSPGFDPTPNPSGERTGGDDTRGSGGNVP